MDRSIEKRDKDVWKIGKLRIVAVDVKEDN